MANEPASSRRSLSPESSGRDSPLPTRQWRNQLGSATEDAPSNDKAYRKYASGVERALTLFETALQEWADYISFLNRLLRALQARHNSITTVPSKATIAKRLAQCLNPSLPSGVHQKALEVYNYVFTTIGQDGLARDLPLYLPGLASTLSFASLSVRAPYLDILETHFLRLDPRSLRPAMKSIVLALLPGLEEETSEDFDRTMKLMENFKVAIRSPGSEELTDVHSTGDDFFWQCFFLASITSHSRRGGALAYLVRTLPKLGEPISSAPPKDDGTNNGDQADLFIQLGRIVTSPEPGLLLRCFAAGLADEQLLIQRGFLDLLVTHLPLHSKVLQTRVKPADLELLLRAASGVVIRRDMSLNRRLWAWFLGPDPPAADNESTVESPLSVEHPQSYLTSKTSYFEDHGLHSLTQALLAMIQASSDASPTERARPYRICLSLMDRWEIGGLVVPEVFLPIVDSVRQYKSQSSNKNDFNEVFKSASVFFDGVESGLIYGEMVSLLAQAIGPSSLSTAQRLDKLDLVTFILANFNIREEEMITIHAPLTALSILCMLEDAQDRQNNPDQATLRLEAVTERILEIALSLFDLIPDRAFPTQDKPARTMEAAVLVSLPVIELLKRIKAFYVNDQGSLDAANAPFTPVEILLNPYAESLSSLHLEEPLIERLSQSLTGPDPYVQVLLLDVVFATLKIRHHVSPELPTSPMSEKGKLSVEPNRGPRSSMQHEEGPRILSPPPSLLKCLQSGLSATSSRSVLDSWVSFLTECLPLYSDTIFQVLIPLVETLCKQVSATFDNLQTTFRDAHSVASDEWNAPESTLISLLNALEQVLARGHERLLAEEARTQVVKGPDQQQGFFGNMVSGVFASDGSHSRSVTANDRLTVHLAFQDAVRICFTIWSWGQGADVRAQDITSVSSFNYTSLRMRNRARRLLEHLFAAETLECLETAIGIWRASIEVSAVAQQSEVFKLLPALDGSRPRHTIPAIFNAIYSRTNPQALDPARRSTLTISLQDTDLVTFLVEYARSLEDDAMDEIWQDCMAFLRDLLANPFPHRQTLPSLLEFAAILGEKVDNTNFGEQRKMRRELGDLFLRLLTAIFTTKPMSFAETASDKGDKSRDISRRTTMNSLDRAEDVVAILASIVPTLPKVLVENDRVLSAAGTIAANVIGPAFRAKGFPETVTHSTLELLQELARLPNNQKTWKKDVGDAFNDGRFFGTGLPLVRSEWLPLLRQWTLSDKDRMPDILARISPPTTAGIVFGVGATSARLEADRKTQLNLRRVATLVLAASEDTFVSDLPTILEKVVELLGATSTSSPSSSTRSDIFMVVRALVLKTSAIHLAMMWPIINAELHSAISSVVAPDHSSASETYNNISILQACKLLDLLICVAPDDFQLHEWLFITDTIDAVYRASNYQPVALVDELSEELGQVAANSAFHNESAAHLAASSSHRRPLLGAGGIKDEVTIDRKDELVAKILRPFFGQLSIFAFESTYAMAPLDLEFCIEGLLKDVFDERTIVRAL
ncbi:hypothetical protein D7B24_000503 [Verticillium nonalfalfae]|uniref:Uncharacterized protein n=1 Tax=Verticillium nonalfalfae TaxID=1051616 RepID=A0A3M9Y2N8_9PEZI|nr:uncharacterized protein D7B24_000503 [Verticillium nonalfalfae]RNJ54385.1 hypothetical protein D7B24_000503 [Verticillium nonalfalfae]